MSILSFGTPDIVITSVVLLSIFIGIARGFIKESISLITWVVAIALSVMFSNSLAAHMTFTKVTLIRTLAAFLIIFVSTVFLGAIINYMVGLLVRKTPFSTADRALGSLFGLFRGIVVVTLLVLIAGLTPLPEENWWQQSYTISRVQVLAKWLKDQLPEENAKAFHFSDEIKQTDTNKVIKGGSPPPHSN